MTPWFENRKGLVNRVPMHMISVPPPAMVYYYGPPNSNPSGQMEWFLNLGRNNVFRRFSPVGDNKVQ
jgi:hypothetical protein